MKKIALFIVAFFYLILLAPLGYAQEVQTDTKIKDVVDEVKVPVLKSEKKIYKEYVNDYVVKDEYSYYLYSSNDVQKYKKVGDDVYELEYDYIPLSKYVPPLVFFTPYALAQFSTSSPIFGDVYVNQDDPNATYTTNPMYVRATSGREKQIFLKYTVPEIDGIIGTSTLSFVHDVFSGVTFDLVVGTTTYDGYNNITWNNKPAKGTVFDRHTVSACGSYPCIVSLDVSSSTQSNTAISYVLYSDSLTGNTNSEIYTSGVGLTIDYDSIPEPDPVTATTTSEADSSITMAFSLIFYFLGLFLSTYLISKIWR